MSPTHRLLFPSSSRSGPCVSSLTLTQHVWQPPITPNSCHLPHMLPGTSLTSTSNFFSSTLVFGSWTGLRLFQEACLVFCSNFSSRARKLRVKSTQARLSQLPLGIGDAVVVGDVAENLGPKDKVELLRQVLGDREEGKLDEERPGLRRLAGSNIYVGASLRGMRIKNAEFIKSSSNVAECPRDGLPEFAVVGRSNVGKSSLVNTLVRRKDLAQTSKKPGKTQLINHFRIDNSWYLVDLPGYGFAKAPKVLRTDWNAFTKDYFLKRDTLLSVLLLVDASIPPQKIDLDCADWLGRNNIPLTVVFTKCDRKKKNKNGGRKPEVNIQEFEEKLKEYFDELPPWVMTSSVTGLGKDELLVHLTNLKNYWKS